MAKIRDFLLEHASRKSVSFHMPGHKGSDLYKRFGQGDFLQNMMGCDITEITGADNLFQSESIIKEAQDQYAKLYDVKKSYLLINGTSGGLIAAIMATVPKGKKLIMARNSHKSVFNALNLADIQPVYAYPEILAKSGISGISGISGAILPEEIEALLKANPDAEAVILPSPNYYGICSDIEAIAKVVHDHDKVLIVDQAHGAHLKFFSKFAVKGFPLSAEEAGADIIVNSIHKTLASFTQSAVLNVNSDRIDPYTLEDKLQAIQSTSPSYLLMASLDINRQILADHGRELMGEWADNINLFYENAGKIKGLSYIDKVPGMDWTKINISFERLGLTGADLEKLLMDRNIFVELYSGNLVMCMTGIGNTRSDIEKLLVALREISASRNHVELLAGEPAEVDVLSSGEYKRAKIYPIPTERFKVPLLEAEGLVCASSLIPYPPGIPLICPGEIYEKETLIYLKSLRDHGGKVIGIGDDGNILAGR